MFDGIRKSFSRRDTVSTRQGTGRASHRPRDFRSLVACHPKLQIWGASSLIVAILLVLFGHELRIEYVSTIANAERASQSFSDVIAEHTARTFEAIERTLQVAETIRTDLLAGRTTESAANEALRHLQKSTPALLAVGWTNAAGDVVAHSYNGDPVRPNIADLPHFIAQRDNPSHGMFIAPLYRSLATQNWISSVSLRLTNSDGSFAGVVSAPLDLSYFARTYQSVNIAADDVITVVTRDGYILFREPFVGDVIGRSLASTSLFRERLPKSPSGTFTAKSPVDGKERVFAYRAVAGLPLVILVLQDRAEMLERWFDHIQTFGSLIALLILVVFLAAIALSKLTDQLTQKSALLEATLDNMHEGLIVVDQTDRIAVFNRQALKLLDLPDDFMRARPSSSELIGYQTRNGEFKDFPDELRPRLRPRLFGETTNVYERKRPNGTVLEILTVPFANGGVVRTYKDITAWKHIQQELVNREARYRLLADHATDMIFQLDLNFVRTYVSPACREILGYSPEDLVGQKPVNIIHPEDADRVEEIYSAVAAGLARTSVTNRIRHKDDRWIWVEAELRLILDAETGRPIGILGSLRDISARKTLEEEAVAARYEAERAAAVKSQFLATMSHELRTPLNSIIGFTDILLGQGDLAPDARRHIGLIQTASETLLTVVDDVLDFSKIEGGKLKLVPTEFNLGSLIDTSVSIIGGLANAKSLGLRTTIDPRISSSLFGDDQRIRQILLNLLNNGIKFTHNGHVSLEVDLLEEDETIQWIRLSVSDTGIGIPREKLDRLFRHFSQVDSSTARSYGGSGLGLAISKQLVEMMGGTIGVESTPGEGSTFWIVLRFPKARQLRSSSRSTGTRVGQMAAHLLLVEDVDVNREIACAILKGLGYEVDAVSDGASAILAVQAERYDLVLMDVQMPGMDGLTATTRIRTLSNSVAKIPIVAMTANVLPDQIAATAAAGMNGHVGKPIKRDQLNAEIQRCLQERTGCSETRHEPIADIVDERALAAVSEMLGVEKAHELLEALSFQLEQFISESVNSTGSTELAKQAHRLVASAGMLGFVEVADACALFEQTALNGSDIGTAFDQVCDVCITATDELAKRLSRPGHVRHAVSGRA